MNNISLKKTIESLIKAKKSLILIGKLPQDFRPFLFRNNFTLNKTFSIYFFGNDEDKTKKFANQKITKKSINIARIQETYI